MPDVFLLCLANARQHVPTWANTCLRLQEIAGYFDNVNVDTPCTVFLVRYPDNEKRCLTFHYITNSPDEREFSVETTALFSDNFDGPHNYPDMINNVSAVIRRCAAV